MRLTPADPLCLNRGANLPIQLHELHPQPSAFTAESFLLLEFYSGAARPPGRFSEGFLLRRLHPSPLPPAWRCMRRTITPMSRLCPGKEVSAASDDFRLTREKVPFTLHCIGDPHHDDRRHVTHNGEGRRSPCGCGTRMGWIWSKLKDFWQMAVRAKP